MKNCKICNKIIDNRSVYCRQCNGINRRIPKPRCTDCNKEIVRTDAKRCRHCARIYQYKTRPETNPCFGKFGKKHPTYKIGHKDLIIKCSDCNKKLHWTAYYHGYKRCKSCARKEQYKDPSNHPNWLGGVSFEPYSIEFTKNLKNKIRERDDYKCQKCDCIEEEHLKRLNKVLAVHHINYNKEDCSSENLITLCTSCNTKANKNRDFWFMFFSEIINQRTDKCLK